MKIKGGVQADRAQPSAVRQMLADSRSSSMLTEERVLRVPFSVEYVKRNFARDNSMGLFPPHDDSRSLPILAVVLRDDFEAFVYFMDASHRDQGLAVIGIPFALLSPHLSPQAGLLLESIKVTPQSLVMHISPNLPTNAPPHRLEFKTVHLLRLLEEVEATENDSDLASKDASSSLVTHFTMNLFPLKPSRCQLEMALNGWQRLCSFVTTVAYTDRQGSSIAMSKNSIETGLPTAFRKLHQLMWEDPKHKFVTSLLENHKYDAMHSIPSSALWCSCCIPFQQYLKVLPSLPVTGKPFLSHRGVDVKPLLDMDLLRSTYFIDFMEVDTGKSNEEKLAEALQSAQGFRLIVSSNYFNSRWCLGECMYALCSGRPLRIALVGQSIPWMQLAHPLGAVLSNIDVKVITGDPQRLRQDLLQWLAT